MEAIVSFCYKKIIDAASGNAWEKLVHEDTYKEFFMQAQQYDHERKYVLFSEMLRSIPRASEIHYLVSTAARNYLIQLNGVVPDVADSNGGGFLLFKNFRFEIIESHVREKQKHRIAIDFHSDRYCWIGTVANNLLLTKLDDKEKLMAGEEVHCRTIPLIHNLTIHSYQIIKK